MNHEEFKEVLEKAESIKRAAGPCVLPKTPPCEPPSAGPYRDPFVIDVNRAMDEFFAQDDEAILKALEDAGIESNPGLNDDIVAFGQIVSERIAEPTHMCPAIDQAISAVQDAQQFGGDHLSKLVTEDGGGLLRDLRNQVIALRVFAKQAQSDVQAAHAACDGPVSRMAQDRVRPLPERVSALRKMVNDFWQIAPSIEPLARKRDEIESGIEPVSDCLSPSCATSPALSRPSSCAGRSASSHERSYSPA